MAVNYSSRVPDYCVAPFAESADDLEVANLINCAILAPYVELTFLKFGLTLYNNEWQKFSVSVGNNSSPLIKNTAAIQSCVFSVGQAITASFEIIDTDGGNFDKVYRNIIANTCVDGKDNSGYQQLSWDWGWIALDDNGVARPILASRAKRFQIPDCGDGIRVDTDKFYGNLSSIKVSIDSKSGMFKYTMEVLDIVQGEYQPTKVENVFGKEEAPMALKDAMEKAMTGLCAEGENKKPDVKFIIAKLNNDGSLNCESFKANNGGAQGPKGVWPAMGLSAHDAVTEWKNNFVGANGKGSIHGVIPTNPPTLILVTLPDTVDPSQTNNANAKVKPPEKTKPYATYVVNGGNNSPVISFEPKFNYVQSYDSEGSGGNSGGAMGPPQGVNQDPNPNTGKVTKKDGPQVRLTARYYDTYNTAPANVLQQKANSYRAQSKSMGIMENLLSYEADLTIQGDPIRYCQFWPRCAFSIIGIIFINPFQLSKSPRNENEGIQPDISWIAPDVCSKLLTRAMSLKAITHSISGGKYTTKLSLIDFYQNPPTGETVADKQQP